MAASWSAEMRVWGLVMGGPELGVKVLDFDAALGVEWRRERPCYAFGDFSCIRVSNDETCDWKIAEAVRKFLVKFSSQIFWLVQVFVALKGQVTAIIG